MWWLSIRLFPFFFSCGYSLYGYFHVTIFHVIAFEEFGFQCRYFSCDCFSILWLFTFAMPVFWLLTKHSALLMFMLIWHPLRQNCIYIIDYELNRCQEKNKYICYIRTIIEIATLSISTIYVQGKLQEQVQY